MSEHEVETQPEPEATAEVVDEPDKAERPKLAVIEAVDSRIEQVRQACSGGVQADQLMSSLRQAIIKNPKVRECTGQSAYQAVVAAAKLGIDPSGEHNSASLVPYWNKDIKAHELTLQIGYGGYIELITRSGEWVKVDPEVVYEGEHYKVLRGTEDRIEHEVDPGIRNGISAEESSAKIIAAYAVATHHTGVKQFVTLSQTDIAAARKMSKRKYGPWTDRFGEMVKKTAVRSLAKWMRLDSLGKLATRISDEGDGYDFERRREVENTASAEALDEMGRRIDALEGGGGEA